ncbi:hypothetical protein PRIPAC_92501 [Pristionchus pacificus]|uniref:Fatty-acid and retinol-binding protein 1 n=1 Tax=Pristionchus pacificus TaxID=54126 RepID=A0A2A6B9V3_PRIPA|nr:hypothetical protein PRIPAC_92501 [Pristionchus pacificus]|eukprot:PDM62660.1 hypothetical protein PRIPAC_49875 [Pristionchus pacificus]
MSFKLLLLIVAVAACAAPAAGQKTRSEGGSGKKTAAKGGPPNIELDDKTIDETVAILAQSEFMPREARAVLYGLDGKEKRAAAEILVKYQNETVDKLDYDKIAKELKKKSPSMHRKMLVMSRMARSRYDRLQPETKEYLNNLGEKAVARRDAISKPQDKQKTFVARRDSRVATEMYDEFRTMKPSVREDLQRHFAEPMAILDSPYASAAKYFLARVADGN